MSETSLRLNADIVKAQIARLLVDCPDLREDDEALVLSLESETDALKLCNRLARNIRKVQHDNEAVAAYIKELHWRQEKLDRRIIAYKHTLIQIMEAAGIKSLPLAIGTLSLRPNRHVIITDREAIPQIYRRFQDWEPEKKVIAAELRSGNHVPGAVLSNPEPSLSLRMK